MSSAFNTAHKGSLPTSNSISTLAAHRAFLSIEYHLSFDNWTFLSGFGFFSSCKSLPFSFDCPTRDMLPMISPSLMLVWHLLNVDIHRQFHSFFELFVSQSAAGSDDNCNRGLTREKSLSLVYTRNCSILRCCWRLFQFRLNRRAHTVQAQQLTNREKLFSPMMSNGKATSSIEWAGSEDCFITDEIRGEKLAVNQCAEERAKKNTKEKSQRQQQHRSEKIYYKLQILHNIVVGGVVERIRWSIDKLHPKCI